MAKNKGYGFFHVSCSGLLFLFLIVLLVFPAYAMEKPVEGYVYDGQKPLKEATIKVLMRFLDGSNTNNTIICLTYPTISTDPRGYFITNLGNLRVLGSNYPCEDRWKKGYPLSVIANGFYTEEADGSDVIIDSESGSTLSIKKLLITGRKFEPLYGELSLANMKIMSLTNQINWDSKNIVFNAEVYNPNNIAIEEAFLKIVITSKKDRNNIIKASEERFGIPPFEKKQVQVVMDARGIRYGSYLYNAVLYTPTMTHDRILDQELNLRQFLAYLTLQNIAILIMAIIIIILIIKLAKGKKKEKHHADKS